MNYCYDMYKCAFIMLCKCIISMLLMWWFKLIWSDSAWDWWIPMQSHSSWWQQSWVSQPV